MTENSKRKHAPEAGRDMIYKLNSRGAFSFLSTSSATFFEATPAELEGKHYTELVHESHRQRVSDFYKRQLAEKIRSTYFEFPVIELEGEVKWVGQSAELVEHSNGEVEIIATARDISDKKKTEAELDKSNFRLNALIKNLNSAILVENEKREIVFVNQCFCDYFSIPVPPEELLGTDCSKSAEQTKHLFAQPDAFVERVQQLLAAKREVFDEPLPLADGRIMERDYIPVFSRGRYSGHMWHYRDVTERVKVQDKIRESEERYRSIIENINLGLLEVDLHQNIQYANRSFCKITGYSKKELIGNKADELLLPETDKEKLKERVDSANQKRKANEASAYELKLRKKNGDDIWVIISGAPIINERGEVVGSLGIHNDITLRKKEELERQRLLDELSESYEELSAKQEYLEHVKQALQESEAKHRTIVAKAMDAVIIMGEDGRVIDWNHMAENTFGYAAEECIGALLSDLIIPEKFREAHQRGMTHFLETGEGPVLNNRIEIVGQHREGHIFPIELSIVPLKTSSGWVFSAFLRDISQRKKSEDDMAETLEQQKQLSQLRSRFVSMTSHELRTPLTTIKSNVDLLEYKLAAAEKLKGLDGNLSRIKHELQRLTTLMTDILMLGKLEDGKIRFKPRSTDLVQYVSEIAERHFQPWQDGRNLVVELFGAPRMVKIDGSLFKHVVENLLSNAFKYSPDAKPPRLELHYLPDVVKLEIQDFGMGIPEEEQPHIFESFFRANNVASVSGTGMGLAIVKQFLNLHQAEVSVQSAVGEGSMFSVRLKND